MHPISLLVTDKIVWLPTDSHHAIFQEPDQNPGTVMLIQGEDDIGFGVFEGLFLTRGRKFSKGHGIFRT
jgi:hypothetical protein